LALPSRYGRGLQFVELSKKFCRVRRLAHTGSIFSGVGASGKPGAVEGSSGRPDL